MEIEEWDRDKTALFFDRGLYRLIYKVSDISHVHRSFQKTTIVIVANFKRQYALALLEDIVLFSIATEKIFSLYDKHS